MVVKRPFWEYLFWPGLFAGVVITGLSVRLYQAIKPPHVVRYYNVWVVKRTSDQSFHALAYNAGLNDWNEFVVTSCPDWTPTQEIQTGVTLKLLQFVEIREHSCMELTGDFGGYTLLRDSHDLPIVTDDPRSNLPPPAPRSPAGWTRASGSTD